MKTLWINEEEFGWLESTGGEIGISSKDDYFFKVYLDNVKWPVHILMAQAYREDIGDFKWKLFDVRLNAKMLDTFERMIEQQLRKEQKCLDK